MTSGSKNSGTSRSRKHGWAESSDSAIQTRSPVARERPLSHCRKVLPLFFSLTTIWIGTLELRASALHDLDAVIGRCVVEKDDLMRLPGLIGDAADPFFEIVGVAKVWNDHRDLELLRWPVVIVGFEDTQKLVQEPGPGEAAADSIAATAAELAPEPVVREQGANRRGHRGLVDVGHADAGVTEDFGCAPAPENATTAIPLSMASMLTSGHGSSRDVSANRSAAM